MIKKLHESGGNSQQLTAGIGLDEYLAVSSSMDINAMYPSALPAVPRFLEGYEGRNSWAHA
jgi:hypothetical protein